MGPPARLERATQALGGPCSIRLSYGGAASRQRLCVWSLAGWGPRVKESGRAPGCEAGARVGARKTSTREV